MRHLRILLVLTAMTLLQQSGFSQQPQAPQSEPIPPRVLVDLNDPYDVGLVRSAASLPPSFEFPKIERHVWKMGDRAAVAMLKAYSEDELRDPKKVEGYLNVLQQAFAYPSEITFTIDKEPKATLFLLHWLKAHVLKPDLQKQIDSTIAKMEEKARSI